MESLEYKKSHSQRVVAGLADKVISKLRVASSNSTVDKNFSFAIFTCFLFIAARMSPYK